MTDPRTPLEQAYAILAGESMLQPTVEHLRAIHEAHVADLERMLDAQIADKVRLCQELTDLQHTSGGVR